MHALADMLHRFPPLVLNFLVLGVLATPLTAAGTPGKAKAIGPHPGWKTYATKHFLFYYAPDSTLDKPGAVEKFAEEREAAHANICKYLAVRYEQPIRFFAYDSNEVARPLIGRDLGFASPSLGVIHSKVNQTVGHELAHILSRAINGREPPNRVLDEGLAVFLNQSNRNPFTEARNLIEANRLPTFAQMLENSKSKSKDDWYPAAGAFVGHLCQRHGVLRFKQLWGAKEATFAADFQRIYGKAIAQIEREWRDYVQSYTPSGKVKPAGMEAPAGAATEAQPNAAPKPGTEDGARHP